MANVFYLLAMCLYSTYAFSYSVRASEKKCFVEQIPENSLVIAEFKTEPMTQETPLRVAILNSDKEALYD